MKPLPFFLLILLLPAACAQWPSIRTPGGAAAPSAAQCTGVFPQGRWQLVHSIEATPPGGESHLMMGVVQLASRERSIHCVMLTVEGLVMLEADYDGAALHVQRAVAPLDRPGLAEGMVRDLLLIFFAPAATNEWTGVLEEGAAVCRYALPDGSVEDILPQGRGLWSIHLYTPRGRLARTVRTDPQAGLSPLGLPNRIVLQASGVLGYRMTMTLLEAQPLADTVK